MADYRPRIPVRIRTARKRHRCDDYLCKGWIEPGERYEDHRLPPGDIDVGNTHWIRHKVHAPRWPERGPDGCALAGAYQERARREAAGHGSASDTRRVA
jgi:hypothetical protein